MIARNCNFCQAEYEADQRYLNRGQGLFCSRKCAGQYKGLSTKAQPNTFCSFCNSAIYKRPSFLSKYDFSFCDKRCQDSAAADKSHPYSVGPRSTRQACKCGKSFRGAGSMCRACTQEHTVEAWLAGDNNASLSFSRTTGQPSDTKAFVKRYLLKTRGDRCETCGFDEKAPDGRSIIQMDHINGNCFDNRLENLKLLCPNHHAMTPTYGNLNRGSGRGHRRRSK